MYKLKIFMIDPEKPGSAQYMFLDREDMRPEIYRLVYEGFEESTELEKLFEKYNKDDRLNRMTCRSLSVSDIVCFEDEDGSHECHICKMIGWKRLSEEIYEQLNGLNIDK